MKEELRRRGWVPAHLTPARVPTMALVGYPCGLADSLMWLHLPLVLTQRPDQEAAPSKTRPSLPGLPASQQNPQAPQVIVSQDSS